MVKTKRIVMGQEDQRHWALLVKYYSCLKKTIMGKIIRTTSSNTIASSSREVSNKVSKRKLGWIN